MRIAGWTLLVGGLFLCLSVVWAALGFLMMGFGLISLQVAEHNRRRATNLTTLSAECSDAPPEEHEVGSERAQVLYKEAPCRASSRETSYDRQAWQRLLERDADLAQVTSVLADYGQQYVDEFANDYLSAGDKKRLPKIVEGIIRRARGSAIPFSNDRLESDVKSFSSVGEPDVALHQRDHRAGPLLGAASKFTVKPPSNPPAPFVEAKQETTGATVQDSFTPEPNVGGRNNTITSADQDLTDLLSKFAPEPTVLHEN